MKSPLRELEAKYKDIAERAAATMAQTFIAVILMSGVGGIKAAAAAAIASALSVLKSSIATKIGDDGTASLVKPPTDD